MRFDFSSSAITREQYMAIEGTLTRPLSLGGVKRRPSSPSAGELRAAHLHEIQVKPNRSKK